MTDFFPGIYRLELMRNLQQQLQKMIDSESMPELEQSPLPEKLAELIAVADEESVLFETQQLISNFVGNFPQLTPLISRDLLWLLGGDCLHWMPDEEVELYQQLDELYHNALENDESFNWVETRKMLSLKTPNIH